ncbi:MULTISPECIES: 1-deoxy-D-xylulose-5-phosphate reductoisomerase [Sphingobacterium]|uniref:1-deoxy-D-xylulose 5-phosphate reductoisomerase n=1 Tax=Sphingobacterium multivorum TaxID=28454 RepID=A0A2X2LUG8_SPHMU|nr:MULTISPECIES: 1-deoxy-D-xylulose-5-phosphate reductoisomerase [Sphingobacterium]HAF35955.1 1-deoxy-D-xylulose-5-phosphate reductoisomerase [Sphingobacterium sp.]MDF2851153.1 1-deoxy-D-xylulose-5-phosphate reductoisomerase [Sphingobacterium multivorum]QQT46461.1 1-deoxy-D-xylulose-5-phosphate reductoisomerase [Sphingobacterium multivorum]QRQ62734.1 1-deoxy-D-xylulose-5-phosphate reductoisomerase [Sphingobacterium multivorum]SPZ93160.1 1-deoxy-D-xylulose 5-phosphate reductoisomerase [Sphingob
MSKKGIAILGATGSIGTQALDVIRAFPNTFEAIVLTCGSNVTLLIQQALEFKPKAVVVTDSLHYNQVQDALKGYDIAVLLGEAGLVEVVQLEEVDIVLNAIVGSAGLKPTVKAIQSKKDIALANKETLVVAGELIMALVKEYGVRMLPVDSEHSAIFQCLTGEEHNPIEKIYVTASGGPFRGKKRADLLQVTKAQALKHPNWSMGAKITIDSASLMNKGLEVIEAKWLFNLSINQVDVIVHPQSIVHSLVQFQDGSMKAQMGIPDMKLPIQYALTYPARFENSFERFNFMDYPTLSFEKADMETFRNLALAYESLRTGGNRSCVLNAANEVVVDAFLKDQVGFLEMSDIIEQTLDKVEFIATPTLDDYLETDRVARLITKEIIKD